MVKRFSDWLYLNVKGRYAIMALAVFVLFVVFVLPKQSASSQDRSGDVGSPDLSLYYSPSDLYQMAESYGEEGRTAYIQARATFDLIWPIIYTLFLTTAITWIFGRTFAAKSILKYANLVPIVAMMFDYLENLSTSIVMFRYPQYTPGIDALASIFTLLKWISVTASFLLVIIGGIAYVLRWKKER